MTTVAEPTQGEILERLDRLTMQMDYIAEQVAAQAQAREKWAELTETLTPVTKGAMEVATRELDELSEDVTLEDVARLSKTLARSLPQLEAMIAQLEGLSELAVEAFKLSSPAMAKLTEVLQVADDKGYFAFARQGAQIADNVVTEFSEEDVKALGDNVVTILNAVKEMTQPEVMALVQRTALTMQAEEDHHIEPPSMLALAKSMRDPQTRRGLARVLAMLHTVGEQQPPSGPTAR